MFKDSYINSLIEDSNKAENVKWIIEIQILDFLALYPNSKEESKLDYLKDIYGTGCCPNTLNNSNILHKKLLNSFKECYSDLLPDTPKNFLKVYLIESLNYFLIKQIKVKHETEYCRLNRLLLTNRLSIHDYKSFLMNDLGFDLEKTVEQANTLFMAFDRMKKFCYGVTANVYYFEYVQPKLKCCKFCSTNKNKILLISDLLSIETQHLKPALVFGGGMNCTGYWEPDPLYKLN